MLSANVAFHFDSGPSQVAQTNRGPNKVPTIVQHLSYIQIGERNISTFVLCCVVKLCFVFFLGVSPSPSVSFVVTIIPKFPNQIEREKEGKKRDTRVILVLVFSFWGMENNHKTKEEEQERVQEGEKDDEVGPMAGEEEQEEDEGTVGSSLTMERVAVAKKFIENHYRAQMKHIQERKDR